MSAAETLSGTGTPVEMTDIESELSKQLNLVKEPGEAPVQRARMSNLVIFCDQQETAESLSAEVPNIVLVHPARVLLLFADRKHDGSHLNASVNAWCQLGPSGQHICSEQITLVARGSTVDRLPYAVRGLLIGDLPTNVWWAAKTPPPMGGTLMHELTERVQQVLFDSIGWAEPARDVNAVANWLPRFENNGPPGQVRVASDLNWRRLKYWRRIIGQALSPATAPGALQSISEVVIEHGPHAVVQAWELVSWLASRLRWKVRHGSVQPNVEIAWQLAASHGDLMVRIRRLDEGPSDIRRVTIATSCTVAGRLNFVAEEENTRLSVTPEGVPGAARTVSAQPSDIAELVGKQLSDRERDPIFESSMNIAQVFAQSVLG